MPMIRPAGLGAASADAVSDEQHNIIPPGGALLSMWASCAANGGALGLLIGSKSIISEGTEVNVEASADVIDTDRDQLLFNEFVPSGRIRVPVAAAGTELQFMIYWRPVRPQMA